MNFQSLKNTQSILLIFMSIYFSVQKATAQQDTIYYKSNWRPTTVKDSAAFFRPPVKKEGNLYRIEDYYISGQLQMSGLSQSQTKSLWDGKVTWYNEDGSILQQGTYRNNRLQGEWISFLDGKKLVAKYQNGFLIEGERNNRYASSNVYNRKFNDTLVEINHENSLDGIRFEHYSTTDKGRFLSKYYGADGQLIGEQSLVGNGYYKGVEVFYYFKPLRVQAIRYSPFNEVLGATVYYPNGKLRTLFEQKPEYTKTYYKPDGTILGKMNYRLNNTVLKPVSGTEYYFPYTAQEENIDFVQSMRIYEDEKLLKQEVFYRDGTTKTLTTYKDGFNKDVQISYDENGTEIARATYKGYYPFNGTEISANKIVTFKDGDLVEEINYYPKTEIIFSVKTQEKETYYDANGEVLGTLTVDFKNNFGTPKDGTRFYATYNDNKIASFEEYKDGKVVKRTTFRDRMMSDTLSITFKSEEFFKPESFSKIKEITYYSNGNKQAEIEYDKYKKQKGNYYDDKGELIGTYDYDKKDGLLYEFFEDSNELTLFQEEKEGEIIRLKRYDYGPNNRFGNIDTILEEDIDINCCAKFYTREGELFAELTFKDGKPWEGTIYDRKDRTKFVIKEGKRNGAYQKYDYNQNNILEKGQYINDLREGVFSYYNFKGFLEKTETFKADKLNGKSTFYNQDNEEIASIIYKDDMPYEGTRVFKTGYVKTPSEETYVNGVLKEKVSYDNGDGRRITKYENESTSETTAYYKDSDKKRLIYTVKDNYLDGLVIRYDEEGNEQNRAVFEKNKLQSGTVFLISRESDRRMTYIVLTKSDTEFSVIFRDADDNVLFKAEELVEVGFAQNYINKMNLDINYLTPDRLY